MKSAEQKHFPQTKGATDEHHPIVKKQDSAVYWGISKFSLLYVSVSPSPTWQ
jgi:hypothetical protein